MADKPLSAITIFRESETGFRTWLPERGSEILACKGPFELIRFTTPDGFGIVFCNGDRSPSYANPAAQRALRAFRDRSPWRAVQPHKRVGMTEARYLALVERDGEVCVYCDEPPTPENPLTQEHFVAISCRGPNHIANLGLACAMCNSTVGSLSVASKIRYALEKRLARTAAP